MAEYLDLADYLLIGEKCWAFRPKRSLADRASDLPTRR